MMKFKKFLAKALALTLVAGSVTMGGTGLQKAIVAEAAVGDVTITADGLTGGAVSVAQGSELQFTAATESVTTDTYTWSVSAKPDGVTDTKVDVDATGKLTVAADATVGEYKVKAVSAANSAWLAEVTVTVTAKQGTGDPVQGDFTVTINYANYTAEISTTGSDTYAFVELWKMDKEGNFSKVSKVFSYPLTDGAAVADLSYLKATAVQGIKVYGDQSTTPVEVKVAAQPAKLSLKYAQKETVATSFTGKIGKEAIPATGLNVAEYEYRGQYGSAWLELADLDSINHVSAGSTIVVRSKAVNETADPANNHPAGPEAKVKIAAIPKAPKVKIDYVKNLVTFPRNAQYCTVGGTFADIAEADMKVTPEKLREKFTNDGTTDLVIFVRTKADTKKAASNVTLVVIPAAVAATNDADTKTVTVEGVADVKVTYSETNGKYEFKPAGASFDFSINNGETWKTVKEGYAFTLAMTEAEQKVLVRMTGVKDTTLPSKSVEVVVPAKAEPTPEATPTPETTPTPEATPSPEATPTP